MYNSWFASALFGVNFTNRDRDKWILGNNGVRSETFAFIETVTAGNISDILGYEM